MWWGKTHEDKENSGTYDFDKEYMEIFVRSDAKKSVFPKDELEQGRCNCNLEDHDVVADVLAQMRRVGGLFNPPVDAFWSGLGKLNIAGQGKGKGEGSNVSFVQGAAIDRL